MNLRETSDFFESIWFEKRGLIAALLAVTVGLFSLLLINIGALWGIGGTLATNILVAAFWWWSRQPPVTPVDKIGFLISISCTDDQESKQLQEDFVQPLRNLLKSGKTGYAFHVMEMPPHISSTVQDIEEAQALRIKCRAHFMIFGRVRLREINGKVVHVLDLEGAVSHNPVPDHISQTLSQEFTELMPRKLHVAKENDLLAFQFTSEWTDVVARYVIGLASAISGDWDYAETLFLDVKSKLHGKSTKFPIYLKLKDRVPLRISELYQARALANYRKWFESKNNDFLLQTEANLTHLAPTHQDAKETLNLKAILAFVLRKDIDDAIAMVKKIKAPESPLWHLNMAFLLGYRKELKNAIRHYRIAAGMDIDADVLAQVEEFIVWVLQEEPDKHHLYYCLGFFNWKIKGDLVRAVQDFEEFLAGAMPPGIEKERELAAEWIKEIRNSQELKQLKESASHSI